MAQYSKSFGSACPYLNRIVEVPLAFNQGKPSSLSSEAVATMQRDLNVHQVVTTSQKVLQHLGKPTGNENGELIFWGKNFYQVQGIPSNFKLESHDRGLILVVAQGRVQKSDLTNADFERFHVLNQKLEADTIKSRSAPVAKKSVKNCDLAVGN